MKRAFAIVIVVVLALGMIGLFFPAFLASTQGTTTSIPIPVATTTAP